MNPHPEAWPLPRWIAHRGAGRLAPENTLAAFRVGASFGFRAFECDVNVSADGVPFLLHDETLERTTPERGVASMLPWSELSRIDAGSWLGPAWAGEPLPSLQAVAAFVRGNDHRLDLEIKPAPGDEIRVGSLVAAEAARLWRGDAAAPLLSSFSADALRAARSAAPQLPRALLLETPRPDAVDVALDMGCIALVVQHEAIDDELIGRLRRAGLRVLAYTVNAPQEAQRLLALGIDGLITDAVDRFRPEPDPA